MKVRFISPANIELDEAVRYYDHQLPGLGFRFYQEVDAAIERIILMPEAWTKIGKHTRRRERRGRPPDPQYGIGKRISIQCLFSA